MRSLKVATSPRLHGTITVPGDKSISHRAVIFGAVARGTTRVVNLLEGEDVLCTAESFRRLGISIRKKGRLWIVKGKGLSSLKSPSKILYCGNSGTTLRLMTGLLSGLPIQTTLTGDVSLNSRPMGRVLEPLRKMGAHIEEVRNKKGRFIVIQGRSLSGGLFRIAVASAQLKSALLLAGLASRSSVTVIEPSRSRDHSERMLKAFGAKLHVQGLKVTLRPSKDLKGQKVIVPGDFSSAAFFLVAGLISRDPKTRICVKNVGMNPTRIGLLDVLKKMGAHIQVTSKRVVCGEPVADLIATPSHLRGVKVPASIIPRLIDEVPILSVAAALAKGTTSIHGAEELRIKETDRIAALCRELPRFGVRVKEKKDGLDIFGGASLKAAHGRSYGDHRMAMSLAILGTQVSGTTKIDETDCIATSFPTFEALFRKIGGKTL